MLEPDLKALVVVDMQRCALPPAPFAVPDLERVVRSARTAIDACRAAGVAVIFTRHRQLPTFLGLGSRSGVDAVRESPEMGELIDGLGHRSDVDQCLFKQRWSAFAYTDLDLRLSVLPGTRLAVAGIVTDACVQQTAYDAFDRQLRVVLVEDAIGACTDGEHMAGMLSMANWLYECSIIGAERFAAWLAGDAYAGWTWTGAHEFPYTTRSLEVEYRRLAEGAGSARAAHPSRASASA